MRVLFLGDTYIGYSGLHVLGLVFSVVFTRVGLRVAAWYYIPLSLLPFGCLSCLASQEGVDSRCTVSLSALYSERGSIELSD